MADGSLQLLVLEWEKNKRGMKILRDELCKKYYRKLSRII